MFAPLLNMGCALWFYCANIFEGIFERLYTFLGSLQFFTITISLACLCANIK